MLSAIFRYIQTWIMTQVTQTVTFRMRQQLSEKINRFAAELFDKQTYGEVLSRITNDVDTISQTLNQSLSQILTSTVTVLGILVMMFSISWQNVASCAAGASVGGWCDYADRKELTKTNSYASKRSLVNLMDTLKKCMAVIK